MKIILDAMGGDLAPTAIVHGALDALKDFPVEIALVGKEDVIRSTLTKLGCSELPKGLSIVHAPDVVEMHDAPENVLRERKESSMVVGLKQLAAGDGDVFISAGSTGALLTAATLVVKRIRGIRRAALCPTLPLQNGPMALIDCGATSECTPEFLLQFAFMGSFYAQHFLNIPQPRVALLNNGTEETKGTELQKAAYALLQKASQNGSICFIGNMEGREAMLGACDVLVADGFTGNIFLKTVEGTAKYFSNMLKEIFSATLFTKLGALLTMKGIKNLKKAMDYRETGGTLFLGLSKPVIKAHGASDERAIYSAIRQAVQAVESGVTEQIAANIDQIRAAGE